MKSKNKEFTVKVVVSQKFHNYLDVEASSRKEAIEKARKLCNDIKICGSFSRGYLSDNKISDYWVPQEDLIVEDAEIE